MKRTAAASPNTLKSEPRIASVASSISRPKSEIGLVCAVAEHGLVVRHARKRDGELDVYALSPDRLNHSLHQADDELLVREGHLHVELRDLLDTVGTQVLVPEAHGDLVVPVEAGNDEKLLENLRRLGECVEAAGLEPARHDEVPCPLRRRLEEDRSLDVDEPGLFHYAADDRHHLCPQPDVALELVST